MSEPRSRNNSDHTIDSIEAFFGIGDANDTGSFVLNSKKDVMKALSEHVKSLISIRLAQPMTLIPQAMKDFRRERVLFNEIPFIPDKTHSHRNIAFALTLKEYMQRMRRVHRGCDRSRATGGTGMDRDRKGEWEGPPSAAKGSAGYVMPETTESDNAVPQDIDGLLDLSGMSSEDIILQRACRTSAGADSFFMVQRLFATVRGTFVTQRTNILGFVPFVNGEPPVVVDVYLQAVGQEVAELSIALHLSEELSDEGLGSGLGEGLEEKKRVATGASSKDSTSLNTSTNGNDTPNVGNICAEAEQAEHELIARIKVSNSFAIYDEDIIDLIAGEPETDPPPWLELETSIIDMMNFRTGEQRRILEVQVYCPETGEYFPPLTARSN